MAPFEQNDEKQLNTSPMEENTGGNQNQSSDYPPVTMNDLTPSMQAAFKRLGWADLMPVQSRTIPYLLAGRDLMVQSRTGSGKTGAYLLPMIERIDTGQAVTQALVLTPTRELAQQVSKEAEILAGESGLRTVAVYGGVGYGPQLDAFRRGAHIVIGTPGRILDHLLRRSLTLDHLRILVFDEADRMLSMGFYPDMRQVQRYLPRRPINATMFSATYPPSVLRLARQFLTDPEFLNLSSEHVHVTEVQHEYYITPGMEKDRALIRIIEVENPASALIFCNTRTRVHYVSTILQRYGYDADELSSDLSQPAREKVLKRLRKGRLRFLVATDVAARGIDVPELTHVILYEPPEDREAYIHRAGRTGRAGASGVAISLVNALEERDLKRIGEYYKINFEQKPLPTEEDVSTVVGQRAVALLEAQLRQRDKLKTERLQRFAPLVQNLAEHEDSLPLLAMLIDDYYHTGFHQSQAPSGPDEEQPPEQVEEKPRKSRRRGRGNKGGRDRKSEG
jgi:ATP-dependent RNA helicase DeaD